MQDANHHQAEDGANQIEPNKTAEFPFQLIVNQTKMGRRMKYVDVWGVYGLNTDSAGPVHHIV